MTTGILLIRATVDCVMWLDGEEIALVQNNQAIHRTVVAGTYHLEAVGNDGIAFWHHDIQISGGESLEILICTDRVPETYALDHAERSLKPRLIRPKQAPKPDIRLVYGVSMVVGLILVLIIWSAFGSLEDTENDAALTSQSTQVVEWADSTLVSTTSPSSASEDSTDIAEKEPQLAIDDTLEEAITTSPTIERVAAPDLSIQQSRSAPVSEPTASAEPTITQRVEAPDLSAGSDRASLSERRPPPVRPAIERIPVPDLTGLKDASPDDRAKRLRPTRVAVPAGNFRMGVIRGRDDTMPQHNVVISNGFFISRYEVTVGQFRAFVDATGFQTEAEIEGWAWVPDSTGFIQIEGMSWLNPGFDQTDDHPVVCISWTDATAFSAWIGGRLPTEAEWEYAARAGTPASYLPNPAKFAWFSRDADNHPHPVGTKNPNMWGLYDMQGNVWELTQDWYDESYYRTGQELDPKGSDTGSLRVSRGGSWKDSYIRTTTRNAISTGYRSNNIGFRVVLPRS